MIKFKGLLYSFIIIIIGSFITFYGGNLLMSDLSNMFYGVHDIYIISSFPLFFLCFDFVVGLIFTMRWYRYPQYKKRTAILYCIYFIIISIIGIIFSIITGTIIYDSLLVPYPFTCYPLLMLIAHSIFLLCSIINLVIAAKQLPQDEQRRRFKFKYIVYSGVLVILFFLTFYRLGAIMWAPVYLQLRTLHLTFIFYLWTLLPFCILLHLLFYNFNIYKNYQIAIIYNGIIFILNLILGFAVIIVGSKNTIFISAISPALPLERLATKPYDTIVELISVMILSAYYLIYSTISYKRSAVLE